MQGWMKTIGSDSTWSTKLDWWEETYCCLTWSNVPKTDYQGFQRESQTPSVSSQGFSDQTHHITTRWSQGKMDSYIRRTIFDQKHILWWGNDTTHKRPARLIHLGKTRASRRTTKVRAKIRDKLQKNCTPSKLKTRKGGLGKIGYPGGLETRKGGPGKS